MLFKADFLAGIAAGTVTLAFRRWQRPTVRPGGTLRTAVGVLEIRAVDVVDSAAINDADARRAGFSGRADLLAALAEHTERAVYRIEFALAGADPRIALRQDDRLGEADWEEIRRRLDRLDRASRRGPWTRVALVQIRDRPGTRAADLAAALGRDTPLFKLDVRKLKELGLTESLEVGYRLSPRGRVVLAALLRDQPRTGRAPRK